MGKWTIAFSVFVMAFFLMALPVLVSAASQLYIVGVQTSGGTGHTTDDFITLFNPNVDPVNLKDYRLVKRTAHGTADSIVKAWTEDSLIPGYGFYLWANNSFSGISKVPDATSSATVADDNGVAVRYGANDSGQIIDSVAWGQTDNSFTNQFSGAIPAGQMLQRQNLFSATSSFVVSTSAPQNTTVIMQPETIEPPPEPVIVTPPVTLDPPVVIVPEANLITYLPLVITEILPNPSGVDDGQEVVELFNPNTEAVELSGWTLDDGLRVTPSSTAHVLDGMIPAGQYLAIVIPTGKFVLNNSSGDSVQLFSPNGPIVDTITYSGTAADDKTWQKLTMGWQWGIASLGQVNIQPTTDQNDTEVPAVPDSKIVYSGIAINEFYPAVGDSITPWMELYNRTDEPIDISGWVVDVGTSHLKTASDAAILVASGTSVPPRGLAEVSLANLRGTDFDSTQKYWALLFSPDGKSQDAVNVKNPVSQLAFGKLGVAGWQWVMPTPTLENKSLVIPNVKFTEVFPVYKDTELDSFIEIQNQEKDPVFLGNIKIKIGSKVGTLPEILLEPGGLYPMYVEDLPASLPSAGQKIALLDANNKTITSLNYPKAQANSALMIQVDGSWVWTGLPTPGAINIWQDLPDEVVKSSKTKTGTVSAAKSKTSLKAIVPTAPSNKSGATTKPLAGEGDGQTTKNKSKSLWVFGGVALTLLLAAGIIWFYVKSPEDDEKDEEGDLLNSTLPGV